MVSKLRSSSIEAGLQGQLQGRYEPGCRSVLDLGFSSFHLSSLPCPAAESLLGAVAFFDTCFLGLEAWLVGRN